MKQRQSSIRRVATSVLVAVVAATAVVSCGGDDSADVRASDPGSGTASSGPGSSATEPVGADDDHTTSVEDDESRTQPDGVNISVDTTSAGQPIDPRLFGTNVPAWLGRDAMSAPWLLDALERGGVGSVRMPGGSWSNGYDWLACERGEPDCIYSGAARPSDFAGLLQQSGLPGIWTVSINHTAQSAAALVAYFNGSVDDALVIGVDRDGEDWGTVAEWAQLRVDNGHAEPVRIDMWEVGNEVFGGRPDSGGAECADFGWEDVWTCDGAAYIAGDDSHDGYLAIRAAMVTVDPTIAVGAVGVADPTSWSNWGNEVIDGARGELDFYVVHQYGFDESAPPEAIVERPGELWPDLVEQARSALPDDIEIALTEYNLVSFESGDTDQTMTRVSNALFLADTLGRLASSGVSIANQWNIANGRADSGTDYGLIDVSTSQEYPAFAAFESWAGAGDVLLDAQRIDLDERVRLYPTRRQDGTVALIAINGSDTVSSVRVGLPGVADGGAAMTSRFADSGEATLLESSTTTLSVVDEALDLRLPSWSITTVVIDNG